MLTVEGELIMGGDTVGTIQIKCPMEMFQYYFRGSDCKVASVNSPCFGCIPINLISPESPMNSKD